VKQDTRLARLLTGVAAAVMVAVFAASPATAAADRTRKLVGDYAMNLSMDCAFSVGGFAPAPDLQRLGPGSTFGISLQGVASYDGKGAMTVEAEVLTVTHDAGGIGPGSYPVGQFDLQCEGSYEVNDDFTFVQAADCAVIRKAGGPAPPGMTVMLSGSMSRGYLLSGKNRLIMPRGSTSPDVETYSLPDGTVLGQRICGSTGTGVRIWKPGGERR